MVRPALPIIANVVNKNNKVDILVPPKADILTFTTLKAIKIINIVNIITQITVRKLNKMLILSLLPVDASIKHVLIINKTVPILDTTSGIAETNDATNIRIALMITPMPEKYVNLFFNLLTTHYYTNYLHYSIE